MAVADWDAQLATFDALKKEVSRTEAEVEACRGRFDARLGDLTRRTVQGRAIGRAEFAEEPDKLALVRSAKDIGDSREDDLREIGDSREDDLKEGFDWLCVWEKLDPAWIPAPGNTLEAFQALYEECSNERKAYEAARLRWIEASEKLMAHARQLDRHSVGWYAVATEVCLEGSYEGDLIRRLVPTTYTPPPDSGSSPKDAPPSDAPDA